MSGVACHVNLSEHLDQNQYKQLFKLAIQESCNYFTFNVPNSQCEKCGYITKHIIDTCPKCGSDKIDLYDRIIGYLVKIRNYAKPRKIEQGKRYYYKPEAND